MNKMLTFIVKGSLVARAPDCRAGGSNPGSYNNGEGGAVLSLPPLPQPAKQWYFVRFSLFDRAEIGTREKNGERKCFFTLAPISLRSKSGKWHKTTETLASQAIFALTSANDLIFPLLG